MPSFIGTGADQVPVNSMLGSLAYQNADDVKLGKVTYSGDLVGNGNIGVGTTPSYWVSGKAIEVGLAGNALWGYSGNLILSQNTAGYSTNFIYAATAAATRYQQTAGQHQWHTAPSGTAGSAITFTQTMTLDASGNLGLGVTPVSIGGTNATVHVHGVTGSNPNLRLTNADTGATASDGSAIFVGNAGGAGASSLNIYNYESAPIAFYTATAERLRIDASGNLILSGTGATKLQEGTTAQRPASPQEGMIRKNSDTGRLEAYYSGSWTTLGRNGAYLEKTLASGYLNGLSEIAGGSISSTADEIVVSFHDVKTSGTTPTYLELSTFSTTSGLVNVSYFCTRVSGTPTPTLQSYSDGMPTGGTKAINLTNWASANDEYSGEIRFRRTISDYAANYDTWSFSGELHCLGSGSTRSNISISGKFIVSNLASFKFDYIKVKNSTAFTGGRVRIAETKDFSNRT